MLVKFKKWIVPLVVVVVLIGVWNLAEGLVSLGGSTREIYYNYVGEKEEEVEKDTGDSYISREIMVTLGEREVKNQVGTPEEKSVQCVYDFFNDCLPLENIDEEGYRLKELDDGSFCINVGDWYLFVRNENGISHIYKYTKTTEFTEYEKEVFLDACENSEFVKDGDLYVWKIENIE